MKSDSTNGWLIATVAVGIASIIAWVDFGIYVSRLDDTVGIALNAVIALIFTFTAAGFYIQWNKQRRKEKP